MRNSGPFLVVCVKFSKFPRHDGKAQTAGGAGSGLAVGSGCPGFVEDVVDGCGVEDAFGPGIELFRRCGAKPLLHADVQNEVAEALGQEALRDFCAEVSARRLKKASSHPANAQPSRISQAAPTLPRHRPARKAVTVAKPAERRGMAGPQRRRCHLPQ